MQDIRARAALERIDRALSRIETAIAADPKPHADSEELERLRTAHALLRRRVEAAVSEIDSLLQPVESR